MALSVIKNQLLNWFIQFFVLVFVFFLFFLHSTEMNLRAAPPFPHAGYFLNGRSELDSEMVLCLHTFFVDQCSCVRSDFIVNKAGKFGALLNKQTKFALLTNGAAYTKTSPRSNSTRTELENAYERKRYYLAQNTVVNAIYEFFAHPEHNGYRLIIDTSTPQHQTCLVIQSIGGEYGFFAFDPNHRCKPSGYAPIAQRVAPSCWIIKQWTTSSDNQHGLCSALTWRFIYAIMAENYDPVQHETIHAEYDFISRKATLTRKTDGWRPSIGYKIRKKSSVALTFNNNCENLVWNECYYLREN